MQYAQNFDDHSISEKRRCLACMQSSRKICVPRECRIDNALQAGHGNFTIRIPSSIARVVHEDMSS